MKGLKIFSVVATLFAFVACADITGPQNPPQGACSHEWQDGVCAECGKRCSHTWDGCVCTICGKDRHNWVGDSCTECGDSALVAYTWCIKSFCGSPVAADLYIKFNSNKTFTILQRTEMNGYSQYTGTYTLDKENSILSGVYSDGEAWGSSYKYSISEDINLTLKSVNNPLEVSVYVPAKMPEVASVQSLSRAGNVKPL